MTRRPAASLLAQPAIDRGLPARMRPLVPPQPIQLTAIVIWRQPPAVR